MKLAKSPPVGALRPEEFFGFTVSSIGYGVSRRFQQVLAPLGLEPREFALLRGVGADEGASQQTISERYQIPASRMVAFVDGLEQRGLLERRMNPRDRRTRALHLTPSGRKLLARALVLAEELERELTAELTASERRTLVETLHRVGRTMGVTPGTHAAGGGDWDDATATRSRAARR